MANVESLPLDALPAKFAVVLVQHDPDIARGDYRADQFSVALEPLYLETEGIPIPLDRSGDVLAGQRAAEGGRLGRPNIAAAARPGATGSFPS